MIIYTFERELNWTLGVLVCDDLCPRVFIQEYTCAVYIQFIAMVVDAIRKVQIVGNSSTCVCELSY